jgi:hypothetical protein
MISVAVPVGHGFANSLKEQNMNRKWIALFVAVVFVMSVAVGCFDTDKIGSMKLGKFGQTVNVDKDKLSKSIKTQWGKFKFSSKQVTKIKKLKKAKKASNAKSSKYRYSTSKKVGKKKIQVVVTYLGGGKYQLVMGGL